MALEPVIGEQAAKIGMAVEEYAVEIPDLALVPGRAAEYIADRRHRRIFGGLHLDPDTLILTVAQEVVHNIESRRPVRPIDAANIDQLLELALRIVAQEHQQADQRVARRRHRQLVMGDLGSPREVRRRGDDIIAEIDKGLVHSVPEKRGGAVGIND